jgi:hypothetical protein
MVVLGKWVKASATIIESPDAPAGATEPTFGRTREYHEYMVETLGPKGQPFRGYVGMKSAFIHAVGEPMAVEVNVKTGQIRLDPQGMSAIIRQQAESRRGSAWLASQARAGAADDGAVGPVPGAAGAADGSASAENRLATLKQLHDKGMLTEAEYQAKREQIIGEI